MNNEEYGYMICSIMIYTPLPLLANFSFSLTYNTENLVKKAKKRFWMIRRKMMITMSPWRMPREIEEWLATPTTNKKNVVPAWAWNLQPMKPERWS